MIVYNMLLVLSAGAIRNLGGFSPCVLPAFPA